MFSATFVQLLNKIEETDQADDNWSPMTGLRWEALTQYNNYFHDFSSPLNIYANKDSSKNDFVRSLLHVYDTVYPFRWMVTFGLYHTLDFLTLVHIHIFPDTQLYV